MTRQASIEVKGNAGTAALAAACLIYFGYFRLGRPSGDTWFVLGNLIVFYVLRAGGVAMAIVAVWSWAGHYTALLADAVVSVVIGALFWIGCGMMLLDDGEPFNSGLMLLFGMMFIVTGIRNGRAYFVIIAERRAVSPLDKDRFIRDRDFSRPSSDRSLAGELLGRRHGDEAPDAAPRFQSIEDEVSESSSPLQDAGDSDDKFLASFAPDDNSDES